MINPPWYTDPAETAAFNMWACRESQIDSAVDQITENYFATGCTSFTINDVSEEDAAEIKRRVERRINGF